MGRQVRRDGSTGARGLAAALMVAAGLVAAGFWPGLTARGPAHAQDVPQDVEDLSDRLDVPYIASDEKVVETMLDLAKVTKDDYVIDLGSGDGRINIAAAKRFGARGFGVDLNEELVAIANARAKAEGVADRARFYVRDLFQTDISRASILTMYLLPGIVRKLRPRLLAGLRPGTRIVSHDYDMGAWRPDISRRVESRWGSRSVVHFWVVPADVAGTWTWTLDPAGGGAAVPPVTAAIRQNFQAVQGTVSLADTAHALAAVRLRGDRMSFTLPPVSGLDPWARHYSGTVDGDRITGTVKLVGPAAGAVRPWAARRLAGGGRGRR
ncbi:MAG: class I SAM-dependent methyltransferase [Alphaproteobacteria bacterium]|nr:class I SAM-dependent methyltransferase [Alphaproteobacteria bacterium]